MRLAEFIPVNLEPILVEWENFARSIWPEYSQDSSLDPSALRDDAADLLKATASNMLSHQTNSEQAAKSKGRRPSGESSDQVNAASKLHGTARGKSGFQLWALVAEYRALRASVLRLWRESGHQPDLQDMEDVTRFNECIDQSLAEAVVSYTEEVQHDRSVLLGNEQAARRDAEEANRAKDLFLATLSHELRTPLSAIMGWINILRLDGGQGTNLAEALDVIERNTKAQVQLIEDVLDVSRIVSGKLHLEIAECNLINVVSAAIDSVRPAADAREIVLEVQLDPTAACAACDAARIQQVVWNFVSNAIKFTPKGGKVRVSLEREEAGIRISVSDNGRGISPALLPCVFEPFKQAAGSSRRKYGGLGLGLSIVKHIAEMHGGSVEAVSAGEGHGSTFHFRLPVQADGLTQADEGQSAPARSDSTAPQPPPVRLDGLHLLIVDDEADARTSLVRLLKGIGAQVTTASSVSEALALLSGDPSSVGMPDILVSDIAMPGQDGYDFIRELRRIGVTQEKLPAVALTAFAYESDARDATSAGFQAHIAKPVGLYQLTSTIARLAGRAS